VEEPDGTPSGSPDSRWEDRVTDQWNDLLRKSAASVLEEGMRLTLDLENICFFDCDGLAIIKRLIDRGVREVKPPLLVAEQIRSAKLHKTIEFEGEQSLCDVGY
jgi:hypothetical protein